jgi:transcriptional regulator with XRE-family HTH domain
MSINQRIVEIIKYYNLNKNSFSKKIGLQNNTTIGNIVTGRMNSPSYDVICKILHAFDGISVKWLILGEGEMIEDKTNSPPGDAELLGHYKDIIENLKLVNRQLESINSQLIDELNEFRGHPDGQKRKAG